MDTKGNIGTGQILGTVLVVAILFIAIVFF